MDKGVCLIRKAFFCWTSFGCLIRYYYFLKPFVRKSLIITFYIYIYIYIFIFIVTFMLNV